MLANTKELHTKIGEVRNVSHNLWLLEFDCSWKMGERISELEDALAMLQSQLSNEAHPLLNEKYLGIKLSLTTPWTAGGQDVEGRILSQMGTLVVGERSQFLGPHAAPDFLLQVC